MAENTADFVAGWASGAVATLMTQPVDLVITRLQAGTARSISGAISAEPLTALWRGMGPLLAVQPISNALMFVGYGAGKSYAERNQLSGGSALLPVFLGGCAGGAAQSLAQSPAELLKVYCNPTTPCCTLLYPAVPCCTLLHLQHPTLLYSTLLLKVRQLA